MRHVKRSKLTLDRDTIRQLTAAHLDAVRGGVVRAARGEAAQ